MEESLQYQKKVKVIGVGPKGESIDLDSINNAEILLGGRRLLDFYKNIIAVNTLSSPIMSHLI